MQPPHPTLSTKGEGFFLLSLPLREGAGGRCGASTHSHTSSTTSSTFKTIKPPLKPSPTWLDLLFRFAEKPSVGWVSEAPSTRGAARSGGWRCAYPPYDRSHHVSAQLASTGRCEIRTTPWRAFLSPVPAPGFAHRTRHHHRLHRRTRPAVAPPSRTQTDAATPASKPVSPPHPRLRLRQRLRLRPRPATTLVGRDGRYDLVRHGRASRPGRTCAASPSTEAMAVAMTYDYIRDGSRHLRTQSFATIRAETDLTGRTEAEARVAVRIVHAAGDNAIAPEPSVLPHFHQSRPGGPARRRAHPVRRDHGRPRHHPRPPARPQ